jgi:IS1 family transposase
MNVLSLEKQVRIISALTEGCSVRATARLVDVHKESVMRIGRLVGEGCARLHDGMMRDLQVNLIELDEQWAFLGCKQRRVKPGDAPERGDVWLFLALDATTKAILSYTAGKRTSAEAESLALDLRARVVNRPQISSDGFPPYVQAIDYAFGDGCHYGQIVKQYASDPRMDSAHRYSPGRVIGAEKVVISGEPDEEKISTSYIERFNLTTRMHARRYTRLTSGFSRKLSHHRAAVALHIGWYNLTRWHETLRCSPAMALGVTDHLWSIEELVTKALAAPTPPPLATPGQQSFPGLTAAQAKDEGRGSYRGRRGPRLRVIKGGR